MGPRRRLLKNTVAEADQFRRRAAVAFVFVLFGVVGLAFWYFRLQVLQHADYVMASEANRVKLRPVVPGRGLIYDRKGRLLADNVPAFRVEVTPFEAGKTETWLPSLSRIIALTPEDIARFEDERKATRGFKPITLKLRVSEDEVARFAVDRWRYPGIELAPYLNRRYPYAELFAHEIGYVGRIDSKDKETLGEGNAPLTHIGKTGLERFYEEDLRGKIGYEKIETNVDGRPMRQVGHQPATPGSDLRLSLDLDLQRATVAAFGDNDGSAVAIDPRTGEVLAMVSLPSYDSNLFVNGISNANFRALMDDLSRPLFNRNVLGGGPPGSTVKPLIALAGLDSGLRTPEDKVFSTGEFRIPGVKRGWRDAHGGAGWTDLRKSIAQSVNYYYYKLAYEMGIERFDEYMHKYGFGEVTGIDLVGEKPGVVPSPQWKAKRSKEPWYAGETVNAGIGQGYWVATVLQLARGTAAIADGGNLRQPHLVAARRDGYEAPWTPIELPAPRRITDNPAHLRAVQEGMIATVHGAGGTGRAMAIGAPYMMAGKTGTAQKISRKGNISFNPHLLPVHLRHQALFVGYAPAENPTIAVAVMVEHGGFGGSTAAPIARKIFDAWLLGKMPDAAPKDGEDAGKGDQAPSEEIGEPPLPSHLSVVPVAVNGAWAASVAAELAEQTPPVSVPAVLTQGNDSASATMPGPPQAGAAAPGAASPAPTSTSTASATPSAQEPANPEPPRIAPPTPPPASPPGRTPEGGARR